MVRSTSFDFGQPDILRVLVTEPVSAGGINALYNHFEIDIRLDLEPEELLQLIPEYSALIIGSKTQVTTDVLVEGTKLKVVARAGAGHDNINVASASILGVYVLECPSCATVSVAEHTIALLLATARNVALGDAQLKSDGRLFMPEGLEQGQEQHQQRQALMGVTIEGKKLGIIGLGKVGTEVAKRARGLGMSVVAKTRDLERARSIGAEVFNDVQDMMPLVDFLTIHVPPRAPNTPAIIGDEELKLMKRTARVINTCQRGVYDDAALLRALELGTIAGAGIDVFEYSDLMPMPHYENGHNDVYNGNNNNDDDDDAVTKCLIEHSKVVATPCISKYTMEAEEMASVYVCTQVRDVLMGGFPNEAVNARLITDGEYRRLRPFVALIEKMGMLHCQHFKIGSQATFELKYHGDLATTVNTDMLFAALIRGIVGPDGVRDQRPEEINVVNAAAVAQRQGITVIQTHALWDLRSGGSGIISRVTVRSRRNIPAPVQVNGTRAPLNNNTRGEEEERGAGTAVGEEEEREDTVVEGHVSGQKAYISRLGRYEVCFAAEGTLIILYRKEDVLEPIGHLGATLSGLGVNIRSMQVATMATPEMRMMPNFGPNGDGVGAEAGNKNTLMILEVDDGVGDEVMEALRAIEGVWRVNVVTLRTL